MSDVTEFLKMVGQRALANPPTTLNSYELAKRAIEEGVPGDFVEAGIYAGAQCAAMARAIVDARVFDPGAVFDPGVLAPFEDVLPRARVVRGFDSFEGIPMAGPNDAEQPGDPKSTDRSGDLRSSGISACTAEQVLSHWESWGLPASLLTLHPGWFQDTVPHWASLNQAPIAVLRLDGDLYESTKVCLEALYPHVSSRGFVIVDDYALAGCRRAVDEYMGEIHDGHATRPAPEVHEIPGGGGPVWWRKP